MSEAPRRLHTLDGLRGIAALAVVAGHAGDALKPFAIGHFWLAVDLFFLMSGVVLGRTYEPRLAAGLTVGGFLRNRYLRLYPLFALGILVGGLGQAATLLLGHGDMGPGALLAAGISGLLLLPSPTWGVRRELVPLDLPGWSLLLELAANLLFAAGWRRLTDRLLVAVVAASAVGLVAALAIGPGLVGSYWDDWPWGVPRVGFSFFLGTLLQRRWRPVGRPAPWAAPALLTAVLLVLCVHPPHGLWFDGAMLFAGWPLVVWLGLRWEPRRPRLFAALGAMSYPLYVLHQPLFGWLWRALLLAHRTPAAVAPVGGILFIAAVALLCLWLDRAIDAPVRRWVARRTSRTARADLRAEALDTPL